MEINLKQVTIGEVAKGYKDNSEEGVIGYGGLLNIRPAYQREFVYNDKQRNAVMDTIQKSFPLNVMYWSKNEDGTFEVLDGQQRTISFCEYVAGNYSINGKYFHTLTDSEQQQILNYKLLVFVCEGNDKERLEWFETINVAGEELTKQELLNINYTGAWLSDAKLKFSKNGCVAYKIGSKYVKGSPIRQEYLETALKWISNGNIVEYMADHSKDKNASELWLYFQKVIAWVEETFKVYRKEMQGVDWGKLYNKYSQFSYDSNELESELKSLLENEEVTDHKGIYEYVLDCYQSGEKVINEGIARKLSKRAFSLNDKRTAYERQNGICPKCGKFHEFEEMEGDHIIPWWRGGTTTLDNLQMLCKPCNGMKSGKSD